MRKLLGDGSVQVSLFRHSSGYLCHSFTRSRRSLPNADADAQAGAVLFRDEGCAHCHGDGGVGTQKAPSLVDIRKDKDWPPEKVSDHTSTVARRCRPFGNR